jgi:hypothetical protein
MKARVDISLSGGLAEDDLQADPHLETGKAYRPEGVGSEEERNKRYQHCALCDEPVAAPGVREYVDNEGARWVFCVECWEEVG